MKVGLSAMDTAMANCAPRGRDGGRDALPPEHGAKRCTSQNETPPGNGAPRGAQGGQDALPPKTRRAPARGAGWQCGFWRGVGLWERGHLALARAGRRVLLALAFGIALAPASGADGEDATEDAEEVSAVDEPVAAVADAADKETERPPRPPVARDVFVPSEEISEDVEVPFPVDI